MLGIILNVKNVLLTQLELEIMDKIVSVLDRILYLMKKTLLVKNALFIQLQIKKKLNVSVDKVFKKLKDNVNKFVFVHNFQF